MLFNTPLFVPPLSGERCDYKYLKLYFHVLFLTRFSLKEFILLEFQQAINDVSRKHLYFSVKVADIAIVKAARSLDFVFRVA